MPNEYELTPESFDMLLAWLDTDRDRAGQKYEHIRQTLIKIFIWRGCHEAEDLSDITINRVVQKLPQLAHIYVGDPALYFFGVAKKVALECRKDAAKHVSLPNLSQSDDNLSRNEVAVDRERRHECMDECLKKLSDDNRNLITSYYQRERQAKVDSRKVLSQQLGITVLNLRVRTHRVRNLLYKGILKCLARKQN
jgi:RNA polymerase sigma factor (sigma-70 family)